jgi:glucuronate isomerase
MQITDTIADMLTRIRNASSAKHDSVDIPASNVKKAIAQILVDEGYIKSFTVIEDNKQGMIDQMVSLANLGLLGNFIGMLTDSRSFLSYTRHEYFRRIACELIGGWVENGEYPNDEKALEKIAKGLAYNNAVRYFNFDLETK